MSRKIFGFFGDKKHKIISIEDEASGSSFERRVSVSNSGRWKQKNKQRSIINEDIFTPKPDIYTENKQNSGSKQGKNITQEEIKVKNNSTMEKNTSGEKVEDKQILFETAL